MRTSSNGRIRVSWRHIAGTRFRVINVVDAELRNVTLRPGWDYRDAAAETGVQVVDGTSLLAPRTVALLRCPDQVQRDVCTESSIQQARPRNGACVLVCGLRDVATHFGCRCCCCCYYKERDAVRCRSPALAVTSSAAWRSVLQRAMSRLLFCSQQRLCSQFGRQQSQQQPADCLRQAQQFDRLSSVVYGVLRHSLNAVGARRGLTSMHIIRNDAGHCLEAPEALLRCIRPVWKNTSRKGGSRKHGLLSHHHPPSSTNPPAATFGKWCRVPCNVTDILLLLYIDRCLYSGFATKSTSLYFLLAPKLYSMKLLVLFIGSRSLLGAIW